MRGSTKTATHVKRAVDENATNLSAAVVHEREAHQVLMSSHVDTFAGMLRAQQRELVKILKLPPWMFSLTYERKDQASLSAQERSRFLCALNTLIADGTFGQLVDIHADSSHMMHSNPRFLPWHRIYLLKLDQALQAIHPDVSIPYWNWTQDGEQDIPGWLVGVTPTVVTPTKTINVVRGPGSHADLHLIASNTPTVMGLNSFGSFAPQLEGIHNGVHVWVGGSMGSIPTAPADPIFWMHHANIDRLWWVWQNSPQGSGKNPPLSGAAAIMDPWSYTETDTRSITALGYSYV